MERRTSFTQALVIAIMVPLMVLAASRALSAPSEREGLVASVQPLPAGQEWNDRWFDWPHNEAGVQLDRYRYYPMEPRARAFLVAPAEGGEPAALTVKLAILNAAGKPVRSASISLTERFPALDLRLAGLKVGEYILRAAFTGAEGEARGPVSTPFVIRADGG